MASPHGSIPRNAEIAERFGAWLNRYAPPRQLAADEEQTQAEADALARIVVRHAPPQGYGEWLDRVCQLLTERMSHRTWPAGGEVTRACQQATEAMPGARMAGPDTEPGIIDLMADWHEKFKRPLPSMNRPDRTEALIRRGVLDGPAEAKRCGYELSEEQMKRLRSRRPAEEATGDHG